MEREYFCEVEFFWDPIYSPLHWLSPAIVLTSTPCVFIDKRIYQSKIVGLNRFEDYERKTRQLGLRAISVSSLSYVRGTALFLFLMGTRIWTK